MSEHVVTAALAGLRYPIRYGWRRMKSATPDVRWAKYFTTLEFQPDG